MNRRLALLASLVVVSPFVPRSVSAQQTTTVVAGEQYEGGSTRRKLLGNNYRDLWTTPIRVPYLDIGGTAGGLTPTETGGGNQTRSLRFVDRDGMGWVFRSVDKDAVTLPSEHLKGSFVEDIFRDIVSVHHPAASLIADGFFTAAGVLHPHAVFRVMPDDPVLGEFRAEFAGRLGNFEEYPDDKGKGKLFANAREIIESEDLLERLNENAVVPLNRRTFLAARLVDMLLNNFDRHAGQWKWARLTDGDRAEWQPISRDQDKVLVSYEGMLNSMARVAAKHLVTFDSVYPSVAGLTYNSIEFDRRLLTGLDRAVFDSVAHALVDRITNRVIDDALARAPREYASINPRLAGMLRARRDLLPELAGRFYALISTVADVHLSDAPEAVVVTRLPNGDVDVRATDRTGRVALARRFLMGETTDLRIHLHGGDDVAVIRGSAPVSIETRVIGGNGTNSIVDSSTVAGEQAPTGLYDLGAINGIDYGKDTLWNRYPWVRYKGEWLPPGRTRGGGIAPMISVDVARSLGFVGGLGIARTTYGYGTQPYSSRVAFLAEHSLGMGGTRLTLDADQRKERSPVHYMMTARMSDLEFVNFYGFGNTVEAFGDPYHEAHQRQWTLQPAIALDLRGPRSYVTLGPVLQYSVADSVPDRLVSALRPYGFGSFGQIGMKLNVVHDSRGERKQLNTPKQGRIIEGSAAMYPAAWDVERSYGRIGVHALNYFTLPLPASPILMLGAGVTKVLGDAPYHDAAYLGGSGSVHGFNLQRYGGDAALLGTVELRIPVMRLAAFIPLDLGVFGFSDFGRVYVDGESPGGWHRAMGAGVRVGVMGVYASIRLWSRCYGPSLENPNVNGPITC